jgi:hypothetical protein
MAIDDYQNNNYCFDKRILEGNIVVMACSCPKAAGSPMKTSLSGALCHGSFV